MQVSNKNLANLFESESKEGPLLQLFGISQITVFPLFYLAIYLLKKTGDLLCKFFYFADCILTVF